MFEDGDISTDEYRSKRDKIKAELDSIVPKETKLPKLPENWKDVYSALDRQSRQIFWKSIIDHIDIEEGSIDDMNRLKIIFRRD